VAASLGSADVFGPMPPAGPPGGPPGEICDPRRGFDFVVTGVDALTGSERRVAKLAAEGMANKGIAQALFVTVKAVEVHLTSVYRKLGIRSRLQLAEALRPSPTPSEVIAR